jgi:hypothetical protein
MLPAICGMGLVLLGVAFTYLGNRSKGAFESAVYMGSALIAGGLMLAAVSVVLVLIGA